MLGHVRKLLLNQKQSQLKKKYPGANIVLHKDMPSPSIGKVIELAKMVSDINTLEPRVSALSDSQIRERAGELKEQLLLKAAKYQPDLDQIREEIAGTTIQEEKNKVKERLKITQNEIFDEVLPEVFALVREASKRSVKMRHFDVQLAGGIILHEGKISEMATGEGKTLVATLPACLNALLGRGVHVVTVNDYLARRDSEWMGPIYQFMGLSVGVIQHDMNDEARQMAYNCDITYGTNNEFGFDYLRDNMKYGMEELVQRPFYFAIVDEVDSILVDEARTPLIISGAAEEATDKYYTVNRIIPNLKGRIILEKDEIDAKYKGKDLSIGYDYIIDEKAHTANITEEGERKICGLLGVDNLHELNTMELRHHVIQALRAHNLYKIDVDYVVKEGEVIIVDEFTGRLMPGRRWSDGLHQAVEAKEGIKIERENQTLATITFQNYFRMYDKLSGMTGTAFTEANEFKAIYGLDVVVIPTNQQLIRNNYADCVYKTEEEKFNAVVSEIVDLHAKGQPVLVGTISIQKSEHLSSMLKRRGVPHQVLNAKYHELEAQIVAQAGRFEGVTIATNMAGRGTDILLGGNPDYMVKNLLKQQKVGPIDGNYQEEYEKTYDKFRKQTVDEHKKVVELGGLHVLGTERHEARRIDNQLRGRSGRQGDPGSSRFYVSLQDDLMRLFGSERMIGLMDKLGLEEGQRIEHPWITRSIEIAQRRVEQHNFEIRKQLLEYDNVMNKQREIIYGQRRSILEGAVLKDDVLDTAYDFIDAIVDRYLVDDLSTGKERDTAAFLEILKGKFGIEVPAAEVDGWTKELAKQELYKKIDEIYGEKEKALGEQMREFERMIFLQIIDSKWKDHLYSMDYLREGIGLRAYGQRDPLVEYKREGFNMFQEMVGGIKEEALDIIFKMQPAKPSTEKFKGVFSEVSQEMVHKEMESFTPPPARVEQADMEGPETEQAQEQKHEPKQAHNVYANVGRNDPCPCGALDPATGKPVKFKKCHGR